MNKKLIAIISVIVAFGLLYLGYNTFLAPKGTKGSKEVTVQVIAEAQNINETYTVRTDVEFVTDLIKDNQEKLGASLQSSDFGTMVTGMGGYNADQAKNEFFLIKVNGEDATTGTDQIPVVDGDTYTFELATW